MKTDSQLQKDIMAELEWEPRVDHTNIGVAAQDGVVTLSGFVSSCPILLKTFMNKPLSFEKYK
jgi:osmotically-inducible protein OsmY